MKLSLGVHQSRVFLTYDNECLWFRKPFLPSLPAILGGPVADTPGTLQGPQRTQGKRLSKRQVLFQIP